MNNDSVNDWIGLVGCEESQKVTAAFREHGFTMFSCDIQPTRGKPEWHICADIMTVIPTRRWNLIILHPDCTAMALSGNRWYGRNCQRYSDRVAAVEWTLNLAELAQQHSDKVVIENPASVIFPELRKLGWYVQYIQPYQYGHGEVKKTGLALHNVNPLTPTDEVDGREPRIWKMPPSKNRKRDRSETYSGIAKAFASQWGAAS
jgi:hypothetical protein